MKVVVQRINNANLLDQKISISHGLVAYIGIEKNDASIDNIAQKVANKILKMRIFENFTKNITQVEGCILLISQMPLTGDLKHGTKPNFSKAMAIEDAKVIFDEILDRVKKENNFVYTNIFGEHNHIVIEHDGPFTITFEIY